jgi:hypothetical protein
VDVRSGLIVACALAVGAWLQPATADACSAASISDPRELVEGATAIIHVRVRGMCSELSGFCEPLMASQPPTPPTPTPTTGKPYAPGLPPIATPPGGSPPTMKGWEPGAGYELIAVEVIEVLKGSPAVRRLAIPGELVTKDDYNDRDPPYTFVRRGGRSGNCFAYTYKRDAEYLLFLREKRNTLTPYWAALAPVNEQVRSTHDPWIAWVREQRASK